MHTHMHFSIHIALTGAAYKDTIKNSTLECAANKTCILGHSHTTHTSIYASIHLSIRIALMGATYEDTVTNSTFEGVHRNTSLYATHACMHT